MKFLLAALTIVVISLGIWLANSPQTLINLFLEIEYFGSNYSKDKILIDNDSISFLEGGDPQKTPLIMVHGFGGDKNNWVRFSAELDNRFRFVVPDLGGFGESSKNLQTGYDVDHQVGLLLGLVKKLDLKPFHLVGTSMGGLIAGVFAARYPQYVQTLAVFTSSGIKTDQLSDLKRIRNETGKNPLLLSSQEDFDRMMSYVFVEVPFIPEILKQHFVKKSIASREFNSRILRDLTADKTDHERELATIKRPTLILWCDRDRVIHISKAYKLAKIIANSRLTVLQGCGHGIMMERPEETSKHYLEFLSNQKSQ